MSPDVESIYWLWPDAVSWWDTVDGIVLASGCVEVAA